MTGFRARNSWDVVPGDRGPVGSFRLEGWSCGEARSWRVGWAPRPGALIPQGVPPLRPPPAWRKDLERLAWQDSPDSSVHVERSFTDLGQRPAHLKDVEEGLGERKALA